MDLLELMIPNFHELESVSTPSRESTDFLHEFDQIANRKPWKSKSTI